MNDHGGATLRKLKLNDVPAVMQLSTEAGWNQTNEDWKMLIQLSPDGCLALEADGQIVSTATLLCYGRRLAWIGMVLTKISHRGRGFARRLLTEVLLLADRMDIETVKLDATDQGRPLYEKLGFRKEQAVERWVRPGYIEQPTPTSRANINPSMYWYDADTEAFGVTRTDVLRSLASRHQILTLEYSYLLTRPGRVSQYLGPCVAETSSIARTLVENALQTKSPDGWAWDLFPSNASAVAIARDFSFSPRRYLTRMVRGKDLRAQENRVYAVAGFELG